MIYEQEAPLCSPEKILFSKGLRRCKMRGPDEGLRKQLRPGCASLCTYLFLGV
jgi:hypothetical protein